MSGIEQILLEMKQEIAKQSEQLESVRILLLGDYNEDVERKRKSGKGVIVKTKEEGRPSLTRP